jgi:hypothetical protein
MADIAGSNGERKEFNAVGKPNVPGRLSEKADGISHSMANTHLIICAIKNAIGKWIDPPATPDRILRALGKA